MLSSNRFFLLSLLSDPLSIDELGRSALSRRIPTHLILLTSLFQHLDSIQVFNGHQLLLEVLVREVVIGAEAENFLLFQLSHQNFLHLLMSQFTVIVES